MIPRLILLWAITAAFIALISHYRGQVSPLPVNLLLAALSGIFAWNWWACLQETIKPRR